MDGLEDFRDLQGNKINDFYKSYRDSMEQDYHKTLNDLKRQRLNDYTSIMSQANKRGMMYSNFPERSKYQYETNTYDPKVVEAYKTYQTGLDKLRSDALGSYNAIKLMQEQIAHLNSLKNGDDDNDDTDSDLVGEYYTNGNQGTWFKNAKGNNVRFSTFARDNGYDATTEGYLKAAKKFLSDSEYQRLVNIVKAQQSTSHRNLLHNANSYGGTWVNYDYLGANGQPYLNQSDRDFINNLGLLFGE